MAYSPLEQRRLNQPSALASIAANHAATPAQVALAWVMRQPGVVAIPKAGMSDHVIENRAALDLALTDADPEQRDRAFPPPERAQPLAML